MLRAVSGETYGNTIQRRIFDSLGLDQSVPAIINAVRERLAVGYAPLYDDRPWWLGRPLVLATWLETDTASYLVDPGSRTIRSVTVRERSTPGMGTKYRAVKKSFVELRSLVHLNLFPQVLRRHVHSSGEQRLSGHRSPG